MPIYEFQCETCGAFDAVYRMTRVPQTCKCPSCAQEAQRLFSTAGLSRANSSQARAIDDATRTAHAPDVVANTPRHANSVGVTHDPRHAKLPRP